MRIETAQASARQISRLEEVYVRNAPGALRLAYFLTADRELAQDLVQDAFVKVAGRFQHLRFPDAFDSYLRRTVVNLFTSHLRRLRLERAHPVGSSSTREPSQLDPDPAERDRMWGAVRTLPPRQRAALVLRFYEDLSERETAEVLGCSASAANALIARAMTTLRAKIGDEER